MICSYVMGIGEAEAFSERLKRELLALEAANVHAILESEPLVDEVNLLFPWCLWFISLSIYNNFFFMIKTKTFLAGSDQPFLT